MIFRVSFIILSITLFSACFFSPYIEHYRDQEKQTLFTIGGVYSGEIASGTFTLWSLPDENKLRDLTHLIDSAKHRVWIEVYILTEKSTIASLLEAKKRGVDVRVILERNVYNTPYIHNELFKTFKNAGIDVRWASNENFTFTHAKYFLIDDIFFISTGNLSYSTFTKNREFVLFGQNPMILTQLEDVFLADQEQRFIAPKSPLLIFSPTDARVRIENLFYAANKSIILSIQSLSDPRLLTLLKESAEKRNVIVKICSSLQGEEKLGTSPLEMFFSGTSVKIGYSKKPYIHAKAAVVDGKYVFVGSMNFTTNSLDNNREVGAIFVGNLGSIAVIGDSISEDCDL